MNTINTGNQFKTSTAVAQPNRTSTDFIVIHHAAWKYKKGEACQAIFNFHSSKWPQYGRIGYHEVLQEEKDDTITDYHVNPQLMQGANVAKRNHVCYGICAATDFGKALPSAKWFDALVLSVRAATLRYPNAKVVGHKEITLKGFETSCPGSKWLEWKDDLINAVYGPTIPVIFPDVSKFHRVIGVKPSCSYAAFSLFLANRNAPINGDVMKRVYTLCEWLDIDPAFLAALWWHEQGGLGVFIGDTPLGNVSQNPLNIKAYGRWPVVQKPGTRVIFNKYESWQLGLMHSVMHLKQFYGANGLLDVETILPVFAPETDHNKPDAYIKAVVTVLDALKGK